MSCTRHKQEVSRGRVRVSGWESVIVYPGGDGLLQMGGYGKAGKGIYERGGGAEAGVPKIEAKVWHWESRWEE